MSRIAYHSRLLSFTALAAMAFVAAVSCKQEPHGKASTGDIKIGAVLPLTGDAAQWGVGAKRGIEIAVDEVNAAGGINGNRVVVTFEDDQLQSRIGTQAAQKLISVDKVPVIIGSISSSVTLAIAPIAEQNKVVLISPASTSHEISNAGDFIFRTIPSDIYEGGVMARFAHNERQYRRVAIIAVNAAGTKGMSDTFETTFKSLKGKVLAYELVGQGETNFRTSITKVIGLKPEAVYVVGFPLETGHMIKQLIELGFKGQILSAQPAEDPQVRTIAGSATSGLILTTTSVDPNTGPSKTRAFAAEYTRRYGESPAVFSYEAYDAARLVFLAVSKRGVSGPAIRDFLYSIRDFDGASGRFSIDTNGDVEKSIRLVTIREGQIVPYSN